MLPGVMADFHIVTANCLDYEFTNSKRDLEARKGVDGGDVMSWRSTGASTRTNLIPSGNWGDRCSYFAKHENTGYLSLPSDQFSVNDFCGENLDFWKTDHGTWEVYRNGANPSHKFGECYFDPVGFPCTLTVGLFRSTCSWYRSYVCPMNLCT
jgi:hypothetical protein